MAKLLIVADDVTGAVDTGVQLAKRGVPRIVLPRVQDVQEAWRYEPLVVNTESRHATQATEEEAVTKAVRIGQEHGVAHFYKTDSTLRGISALNYKRSLADVDRSSSFLFQRSCASNAQP